MTDSDVATCPVSGASMLILRRTAEVQACLADPRFGLADKEPQHYLTGAELQHSDGLLRLDPPRITEVRRAINPYYTSRSVEGARPTMAGLAQEITDSLPTEPGAVVDFSVSYAEPFIARATCQTLGLDTENWPTICSSANSAAEVLEGPDYVATSEAAWTTLYSFYDQAVRDKRTSPDSGAISHLVQVLDKQGLSHDEIVRACATLSNGFPAVLPVMNVALVELLQHPEVVQDCLAEPGRWRDVVNELMRYKAHFSALATRIAYEDIELGDRLIPAGTAVVASIIGATHDPATSEYPDKFVPGQKGPKNIVFGGGPHYCPGAALSRQWLEVGLSAFFTRFPDAQLDVPVSELVWQSGTLSVPVNIPIRLTPNS